MCATAPWSGEPGLYGKKRLSGRPQTEAVVQPSLPGLVALTSVWEITRIGHKNIQQTVRHTEVAFDRFKDFWRESWGNIALAERSELLWRL